MPFLTEERRMIQEQAREFTLNEVLPVANRLDPEKGDIPRDLIHKMGDLGFFGIMIPQEHGGLGLGAMEYCLVAEELAQGWMSVASLIARGNGFYKSIPGEGAERAAKIAAMAQGRYLGAAALSEPQTGSDLSPCNRHHIELAKRVREGITAMGGNGRAALICKGAATL